MTLGLKKPMRVMALVNHRHSLAVATERADLRRVDGQCPVGVIHVIPATPSCPVRPKSEPARRCSAKP